MKNHTYIKKIDTFGRVTLPKEVRKLLQLAPEDGVKLHFENEKLILEKFTPTHTDTFDNEVINEPLYEYHGKKITKSSIIELAHIAGLLN